MSDYDVEGKRETLFLLDVASLFTRGNLTGAQGLDVLRETVALLRESRKENRKGGMYGALATVYRSSDLPVALMEWVLVTGMSATGTFWRENLANAIEKVIRFVEKEETVKLDQPWRAMLADLMTAKAEAKGQLRQGMADLKEEDLEES